MVGGPEGEWVYMKQRQATMPPTKRASLLFLKFLYTC